MGRSFRLTLTITAVAWAFGFFWLGGRSDPFWRGYSLRGHQSDYYTLLVEGFEQGHLAMNAKVDPDLLSPDPVVRLRAPYLLDAALYQGKYYLYYGVTPAILVLYPYAVLTGNEMGLEVACLAFALAGLAIGSLWLDRLRNWLRADWGPGFAVIGVSLVAIGPGLTFLVRRSSFYDLAIVSGAAFALGYWFSLFQAWTSNRPGRWLALASACLGFAVGSRPTLLLTAPALLVFALLISRRDRRGLFHYLPSAIGPALLIGSGLAWYNFARFGNPLDFGVAHDLNVFFSTGNPLLAWRFLPANLRWYFFTPPSVAPWFPFDFPIQNLGMPAAYTDAEDINGFLPLSILAIWGFGSWLLARKLQTSRSTRFMAFALWSGAGAIGLFTCLLGVRAYRYATDFMTPASLGLVLLIGSVWLNRGRLTQIVRTGITCLTAVAALHALLGSIQLFDAFRDGRPSEFALWSNRFNPPQRAMKWLGAERSGAVALTVRFHAPLTAQVVPLLTTGLPNAYDRLQAIVHPNGYISLQLFHFDYGGPRTELIPIQWDHPYHLEVLMGSLYPAATDPSFSTWQHPDVARAKTKGWVSWEGRTVIDRSMAFFPGTPRFKSIGSAGIGDVSRAVSAAASIDSLNAGAAFPPLLLAAAKTSPAVFRMTIRLSAGAAGKRLPILCSGITGEGDLLLLDPLPNGRYRLVIDQWGYSPLIGPEFTLSQNDPTRLDLIVGPALLTEPAERSDLDPSIRTKLSHRLIVWKDGEIIGSFRLTRHLESFDRILIGRNEAGFTSAEADFAGSIEVAPANPVEELDLLLKTAAEPKS